MVGTGKRKERPHDVVLHPELSAALCSELSLVLCIGHRQLARLCPNLRSSASGSLCCMQSLGLLALPATKGRRHRPFPKIPSSSFSINGLLRAKYGGGRECRGANSRCLKRISSQEITRRIKRPCYLFIRAFTSPHPIHTCPLVGHHVFRAWPFSSPC